MADDRKKRLVPLGVGALGVAVAVLLLIVAHQPLLKWWYRVQLDRAGPEERWELARDYEESGTLAREAVEDWYLDVLRSWKPDGDAISSRDPSTGIWVRSSPTNGAHGPGSFHYPDEKDVATAAARLGGMGSVKAVPLLLAHLERSNPELPLLEITGIRISEDGIPNRGRLYCLHATSLALFELGAEAIDALIATNRSEKPNARIQAALILSRLLETGVGGDRAVDAILAGYCGEDKHLRSISRSLLKGLELREDSVIESVLATVLECLRGDSQVAIDSGYDLRRLAVSGGVAGVALNAALRDRTLAIKSRTALLSNLDRSIPTEVVEPALLDCLTDESRDVRLRTTYAMRTMHCQSLKTVQSLAQILCGDKDQDVRHGAAVALRYVGEPAKAALQEIRAAALDAPDIRVRRLARETLEELREQ